MNELLPSVAYPRAYPSFVRVRLNAGLRSRTRATRSRLPSYYSLVGESATPWTACRSFRRVCILLTRVFGSVRRASGTLNRQWQLRCFSAQVGVC